MKLHLNREEFGAAIKEAAMHFNIREVFIEKDYWVTFVLKNLKESKYHGHVVFKGGTSLSKAYKIAQRFSEDIDLAIVSNAEQTQEERDELINFVAKEITSHPLVRMEGVGFTSRNKKFSQSHWEFPRQVEGAHDPAKDKIMLEITSSATTKPSSKMTITSLIADFLSATNRNSLIDEFELAGFKIMVLSHKRTFAEKVVAVANACFADEDLSKMKDKIRHLYDLTLLFRDEKIKKFVESKNFPKMVAEAQKGDLLIDSLANSSQKPWKSAVVFKSPKESLEQLKGTYDKGLRPLVFDQKKMPDMQEIEDMLVCIGKVG